MPRTYLEGNTDAPVLSGPLKEALTDHAWERGRHFFLFYFYVELSCDYLRKAHSYTGVSPCTVIEDHATHQAGTGFRLHSGHVFDKSSTAMGDELTTGHTRMDAAHFNNLGLTDRFLSLMASLAPSDRIIQRLLNGCVATCANTRLQSQSVNLGPDKTIDQVHRDLWKQLAQNTATPTLSVANFSYYADLATTRLDAMYDAKELKQAASKVHHTGDFYKPGLEMVRRDLYDNVSPEVISLIAEINTQLSNPAMQFNKDDYLGPPSTMSQGYSQAKIDALKSRSFAAAAASVSVASSSYDMVD